MLVFVGLLLAAFLLTLAAGATWRKVFRSAPPGADPPHQTGPATASVTLEEFGDFQCPPCAKFYPELKTLEKDYGPRLRVVFRQFPLRLTHQHALEAARASEAAGLQGRFWQMHDLLYENQEIWSAASDSRPLFITYAHTLGLDVERFTHDLDGLVVNSRILLDQQRGESLSVEGTPTLVINGSLVTPENMTIDEIRKAIDAALGGF